MTPKRALLAIALVSLVALNGYAASYSIEQSEIDEEAAIRSREEIATNSIMGLGIIAGLAIAVKTVHDIKQAFGVI